MKAYVIKCDGEKVKGHIYNILPTKEKAERDLEEAKKVFPKGYTFRIEEIEWRTKDEI